MTDDVAFIRAIVDWPGDDLPRLVYADWLDERGDPRGAYLRREAEWAAAPVHGDEEDIIRLGTVLDPVWVARVSRPPVGVCCDRLRWFYTGPHTTRADLEHFEQQNGIRLIAEHKALLMNWNGGVPSATVFRNPARRGSQLGTVERIYGVGVGRGEGLRLRTEEVDLAAATGTLYGGRYPPEGPPQFAPLAANEFPYMNLIGLTGRRTGAVYWHNYYSLHRADKPRRVTGSLPEFLASLVTSAGKLDPQ